MSAREGNSVHVQTKVTPALRARIERSATRRGQSVSAWMRERAEEFFAPTDRPAALAVPPDRAALEAQLRAADPELYDAMDKMQPPPSGLADLAIIALPGEVQADESTGEIRYKLPHFGIGEDGSCAGGCQPETDFTCSIGPDDPKRTGKRRKRS